MLYERVMLCQSSVEHFGDLILLVLKRDIKL